MCLKYVVLMLFSVALECSKLRTTQPIYRNGTKSKQIPKSFVVYFHAR